MFNLFTKTEMPESVKEPLWTDLSVEEVLDLFDPEAPAQMEGVEFATYLKDELEYYRLFNTLQVEKLKSALIKGGVLLLDNKSVKRYKSKMLQAKGDKWRWDWRDISDYNHEIPIPILKAVTRVNEIIKKSGIEDISMVIEGLYHEDELRDDPFILVEHKLGPRIPKNGFWCDAQSKLRNEGFHRWTQDPFYFGVWDEPKFKGRYFLPTEEL